MYFNNQTSSLNSPYAGGSRPEADLPSNGPPSTCRSGNSSEDACEDNGRGAVLDDDNIDGRGECPAEGLLLPACNGARGLRFSDRLEGCELLLDRNGACKGLLLPISNNPMDVPELL